MKHKKKRNMLIYSFMVLLLGIFLCLLVMFIQKTYRNSQYPNTWNYETLTNRDYTMEVRYKDYDNKNLELLIRVKKNGSIGNFIKKEAVYRIPKKYVIMNDDKDTIQNIRAAWVDEKEAYLLFSTTLQQGDYGFVISLKDGIDITHDDKRASNLRSYYLTDQSHGPESTYYLPQVKEETMYDIRDRSLKVSYDSGETYKEVPMDIETLCEIEGDNVYYNQLQEGAYVIGKKTAIVYGGTKDTPLSVIYSDDEGETWKTSIVDSSELSLRVHYISFPTTKHGYVIAGAGYFKGQESNIVYETLDGGVSWHKKESAPTSHMIEYAGFDSEATGIIFTRDLMGNVHEIYITSDGAQTYQSITLPIPEGYHLSALCFEDFVIKDNKISVHTYMESQGDTLSGTFSSDDHGVTWKFNKDVNQ